MPRPYSPFGSGKWQAYGAGEAFAKVRAKEDVLG
jgi:hypothetical protein